MELNREKLENAFAKVLSKNRSDDPLTLAEKLATRLEYLMEDADGGSGIPPVHITSGPENAPHSADDPRPTRLQPIREEPARRAPPVPEGKVIVAPDEEEYRQALEAADPRLRGRASAPSPSPRKSPGGRLSSLAGGPASGGANSVEYWTIEELSKSLNENTPDKFFFTPNGCDESVKVLAQRNVQTLIMTQGPSLVRLEYANPGVSQDRSSTDTGGALDEVVLGLIASVTFTLDQADLNLEAALDSIEVQLKGLYAPRASQSEPMGRDPGPIEGMFNMNDPKRRTPMGDSYEIHAETGWRNAVDPVGNVVGDIIKTNKKYGNR